MNELVFIENGQAVTDSLTVAEVFGKRHADVLRDIKHMECSEDFRQRNFAQSSYVNSQNKEMPKCYMSKKGFTLLAMGYTGKEAMKFKEAYIEQFEEMEATLKQPRALSEHEQRIELLKLSLEHEQKFSEVDQRIGKLEENIRIDAFQQTVLQKQIGIRVYRVYEEYNPDHLELKKLFPKIHRNLRDAFGVPTYKDIRKIDFDEAVSWVKSWRPLI